MFFTKKCRWSSDKFLADRFYKFLISFKVYQQEFEQTTHQKTFCHIKSFFSYQINWFLQALLEQLSSQHS